jgi:hypothetical protein
MNNYTVVLMRPDYATSDFGQDCYVALVEAEDEYRAVKVGQKEVWEVDNDDHKGEEYPGGSPEDYYALLVFEGHQDVKLFGFQL